MWRAIPKVHCKRYWRDNFSGSITSEKYCLTKYENIIEKKAE
jgi:hypothetical protein